MSTETKIRGSALRENLTGTKMGLLASGFQGSVIQSEPGSSGARSARDRLPLEVAAANADALVVSQLNVQLEQAPTAAGTGGRGAAEEAPRLLVPKRAGVSYAVLQTAPNGESRWLLPSGAFGQEAIFELAPTLSKDAAQDRRGAVTSAIRGVVRVVAWAAAPALQAGALAVARGWEDSRRPYGVTQIRPDGGMVTVDWDSFASGPLLLLVHGTFSTPRAAFDGWVGSDAFRAVAERYEGRCLALAHPSLSSDPDDNLQWLVSQLPSSRLGPLDVVCHSRGGLVARAIAASDHFDVRTVCQVGAPNIGTPLAQAEHLIAFLDGHTAFLTSLPDTTSTILLEGMLSLLKLVAVGATGGLPGLAAMTPDGDYLSALGGRHYRGERWFTIGADFSPASSADSGFALRLADKVVDRVFRAANDLVVPSDGCDLPGPTPSDSLRLRGAEVHHTNYFRQAAVHGKISDWLR